MDLDTALLRTWVAVAAEGHVGRAALRLGISQQAVSKRLARLDRALGTPTFRRVGQGIAPTAITTELVPRAQAILADVDRMVAAARPGGRSIRLDVLDEHLSVLRFVIEESQDGDGDGTLEVVMREDAHSLVGMLRSGRADIAFGRAGAVENPWPEDLVRGTTFLEPIQALVGPGHPWAERREVRTAELAGQAVWFPGVGSPGEWLALLGELARDIGIELDTSGSTMGFEHFLGRPADSEPLVTFLGGTMRAPGPARSIPLVDPVPVFPWTPVRLRAAPDVVGRVAESVVARARAATAEPHPDEAWLPASDRALL